MVWNMNFIFPYIGKNHPNWRTHIFQRGRYTTNQLSCIVLKCHLSRTSFCYCFNVAYLCWHKYNNTSQIMQHMWRPWFVSFYTEPDWYIHKPSDDFTNYVCVICTCIVGIRWSWSQQPVLAFQLLILALYTFTYVYIVNVLRFNLFSVGYL